MDILTEISKFVAPNPTPNKFLKSIDRIFVALGDMEEFINMNTEGNYKKMLLKYNQSMMEQAVLSAEVFQEYVDKKLKEE